MSANLRDGTNTKELIAGSAFLLVAAFVVWLATGWWGLAFMVIMTLSTWFILYLFNKKSLVAKTGAVILNTDLLVKLLMPKSSRNAIRELEEAEKKKY